MGTPTTRARTAATNDSSKVAGKRSAISRETLAPWRRLKPNSPCAACTRKCQNCTKKGWSSPRAERSSRIWSGRASCPSKNTTGSPTYWNNKKEMNATTTKTSTACSKRRITKANIGASDPVHRCSLHTVPGGARKNDLHHGCKDSGVSVPGTVDCTCRRQGTTPIVVRASQ